MYRRQSKPVAALLDFSLFVSFFPHLIAGPIVRPPQLVPQFATPRQASWQQFKQGLLLFAFGLFLKVFLADAMLSGTVNTVFASANALSPPDAWTGALAFSAQLFFDFAGYSTCAIGVALCLGFVLPDNFAYPYTATSFAGFWRRWHITLSAWLRDYLYIPLGGNRKGKTRTYVNIMITMLIGGLWHGASWTFVAWGALHGIYLLVERMAGGGKNKSIPLLPALLRGTLVFGLTTIAWVFFRAVNFTSAGMIINALAGHVPARPRLLATVDITRVWSIVGGMLIIQWICKDASLAALTAKTPYWLLTIIWVVMVILVILSFQSSNSFIYFRF
jgi:alginate O-acetyltransferase complex protein AlgI